MAHHHHGRYDQVHGTQVSRNVESLPPSADATAVTDDEFTAEADEPPDEDVGRGTATPRNAYGLAGSERFARVRPQLADRKTSLLSQAFAPKADVISARLAREASNASSTGYASTTSTADLTSDGGLTSPARTNTPSPPPPATNYVVPLESMQKLFPAPQPLPSDDSSAATSRTQTTEKGPERKPCIRFACSRNVPTDVDSSKKTAEAPSANGAGTQNPPKRPCALRFACPFKSGESSKPPVGSPNVRRAVSPPVTTASHPPRPTAGPVDVPHGPGGSSPSVHGNTGSAASSEASGAKTSRSESSRFHEFASSLEEEEEWMSERPAPERRLTVDDTLKKEKSIRQLGEEAEEEALEEDEERQECEELDDDLDAQEDDDDEEDDEKDDAADGIEDLSDDGDESDNEEGFASSDDEADSEYSFWTFPRSTAATSLEHIDQALRLATQTDSQSPATGPADAVSSHKAAVAIPIKRDHKRRLVKMEPGTPTLPDSTDFVCGTLDEDRPMEDAYVSCLAERKRSTHQVIPQDIDPSFPASDLEDDDEQDLDEDGEGIKHAADPIGMNGRLHGSSDAAPAGKTTGPDRTRNHKSSPKRLHSPPPLRRTKLGRSPPPRRVAETSPKRRLPPLEMPRVPSQPSSRPSSTAVSPKDQTRMRIAQIARPVLTRTISLPRAPNPFYQQVTNAICRAANDGGGSRPTSPTRRRHRKTVHRRGAIDIVCGLEAKRHRLREKAWLKYCHRAAKGKDRKPPPGEGAEKMRELGLVMAGKTKGHAVPQQGAQYILSI